LKILVRIATAILVIAFWPSSASAQGT